MLVKSGDRVRVTEGSFIGTEGTVGRAHYNPTTRRTTVEILKDDGSTIWVDKLQLTRIPQSSITQSDIYIEKPKEPANVKITYLDENRHRHVVVLEVKETIAFYQEAKQKGWDIIKVEKLVPGEVTDFSYEATPFLPIQGQRAQQGTVRAVFFRNVERIHKLRKRE